MGVLKHVAGEDAKVCKELNSRTTMEILLLISISGGFG